MTTTSSTYVITDGRSVDISALLDIMADCVYRGLERGEEGQPVGTGKLYCKLEEFIEEGLGVSDDDPIWEPVARAWAHSFKR